MTPLPRKSGENQKLVLDWSHLEVSNSDCVTYYIVKYWPASDKYQSKTLDVPSNQTSVEMELEDGWNGRPGKYGIKVAPTWRVTYWDSDWDELVPTLTADL